MRRRWGGYTERERGTAALAVTISTLLGAASVAAGLGSADLGPQRSPLPRAAAGPASGAAPLPACAACGPDGRTAGSREQEPPPASKATPTAGAGPHGSPPASTVAPVSPTVPATAGPARGGPAAGTRSGPAVVPPPRRPGTPGTAGPAAPAPPAPAGPGRVGARSTIVGLAPVATVASTRSTLQVDALGTAGHAVARMSLGCGTLGVGVGVAVGNAATPCPADQPPTSPPAAGVGMASGGAGAAATPPGLLAVDSANGGLQVRLLPGSDGALLSLTVCTSGPGLILTILGFRSRCGGAPGGIDRRTGAPVRPGTGA